MHEIHVHALAQHMAGERGHHLDYHRSCAEAFQRLGAKYSAYLPKTSSGPLPASWRAYFSPVFDRHCRKAFSRECRELFRRAEGRKRLFFLESFVRHDFRAFALGALLFGRRDDILWILCRDVRFWRKFRDRFEMKFWVKLLGWKFRKLHLMTDCAEISFLLGEKLNRPLAVVPILHVDFPPQAFHLRRSLRLGPSGEARCEKGRDEIARLAGYSWEGISIVVPEPQLTRPAYLKHLEELDMVLLPYDPVNYARRTSGVLVEAVMMGKIPLVREGSWLARELRRFDLAELIVDWEPERFFLQVEALFASPTLGEKLRKMQIVYAQTHSQESFIAHIREFLIEKKQKG